MNEPEKMGSAFNPYSVCINNKKANENFCFMIDRLIELVRIDVFEVLIILLFGLITGVLFSGISWKGKVTKRDGTIRDFEASIEEKDVDIKKLYLAQEILKKQYAEIVNLNRKNEENKRDRVILSQQINEKVTDLERDCARAKYPDPE